MIMSVMTTKKKPVGYLVFSWAGRLLYGFRLKLESLNDWMDLKAGEYLGEDW